MRTSDLWWLFGKMSTTKCQQQNVLLILCHFAVEIVCYWNTQHFINCSKMCLLRGLASPKRFSLLFEGGGKLISYIPCIFESHLCLLSPPLPSGDSSVHFPHGIWVSVLSYKLLPLLHDLDFSFVSEYLFFCILTILCFIKFYYIQMIMSHFHTCDNILILFVHNVYLFIMSIFMGYLNNFFAQ